MRAASRRARRVPGQAVIVTVATAVIAALVGPAATNATTAAPGPGVIEVNSTQVIAPATDPAGGMFQGAVAANPRHPRHVVAVAEESGSGLGANRLAYSWSNNAGRSWHESTLRGLTVGYGGMWDVPDFSMVAAGVGGDIYAVTSVGRADCNTAVAVARSSDHGRTFGRPMITAKSDRCWRNNGKPWLAVDTYPRSPHYGRLYLSWLVFHFSRDGEDLGQQQFTKYSDDRGRTWSKPLALTGTLQYTHTNSVAVQPDGAVSITYTPFDLENTSNVTDVVVRTSRNGGTSYAGEVLVTRNVFGFTGNADVRCCMQVLSVDPVTGWLYLALQDTRYRDDDLNDVLVFGSRDGRNWRRPVVVNTDQESSLERFTPSVGAYGGTVYVVWTLRAVDGETLSDVVQQEAAVSTDGGRTFGPPVDIGPAGDMRYSPAAPNGFAPRYTSDYNTTVAVRGHAYTAWPQPQAGAGDGPNQPIWVATLRTP